MTIYRFCEPEALHSLQTVVTSRVDISSYIEAQDSTSIPAKKVYNFTRQITLPSKQNNKRKQRHIRMDVIVLKFSQKD